MAFPQAPPPAVPKIQFCVYIGSGVNIARIGQRYHIRRRLRGEGGGREAGAQSSGAPVSGVELPPVLDPSSPAPDLPPVAAAPVIYCSLST